MPSVLEWLFPLIESIVFLSGMTNPPMLRWLDIALLLGPNRRSLLLMLLAAGAVLRFVFVSIVVLFEFTTFEAEIKFSC
jgi:hypothetical protein